MLIPNICKLTQKPVGRVGQVGQTVTTRVSCVPPENSEVGHGGTFSRFVPPVPPLKNDGGTHERLYSCACPTCPTCPTGNMQEMKKLMINPQGGGL